MLRRFFGCFVRDIVTAFFDNDVVVVVVIVVVVVMYVVVEFKFMF